MKKLFITIIFLSGCKMDCGFGLHSKAKTEVETSCNRNGNRYNAHYTQIKGTCGKIADNVISVSADGKLNPSHNCTQSEMSLNNGCNVSVNSECKNKDNITYLSGEIDFAPDGSAGSGVETLVVNSPISCTSTYIVVYTRLP